MAIDRQALSAAIEKPQEEAIASIISNRDAIKKLLGAVGKGRTGMTLDNDCANQVLSLAFNGVLWAMYWTVLLDDGAAFDGMSAEDIINEVADRLDAL